ncbi:LysR family transcriptional regulator [Planomonospora sp. ID67723]|uniref:LysR family transcriptional regulator n=1 Tax=Planomonospora sp. ID67723 TaxID=2738134 RepID=UPI0018C37176|nr:LysR family transcriptional regulator [Planomonospora sp. ID67723]MBG0826763.1 LysR family transcriptional regulator [Planomonospora sp. ID67723]
MLDVRRLHLLATVAARGSITAAARSLSLSAGAVSQQLAALRREVGADLLRPDGRTVALTELGALLVDHGERIFTAIRDAEHAVAAHKGTVGATATLAALPSTVQRVVTPALTALRDRHPQLAVTCLISDQAQLRELVLGAVDVIVGQRYHHLPPITVSGVETHPLLDDPLLVVTAAHRRGPASMSLPELSEHSLALPPPGTECGQAILHACHQAGFTPTARYATADITAQLTLARAGLATALIPAMAIDPAAPGIRTAAITGNPIHRQLFAAVRRTDVPNPTTAAITAAIRQATRSKPTW